MHCRSSTQRSRFFFFWCQFKQQQPVIRPDQFLRFKVRRRGKSFESEFISNRKTLDVAVALNFPFSEFSLDSMRRLQFERLVRVQRHQRVADVRWQRHADRSAGARRVVF